MRASTCLRRLAAASVWYLLRTGLGGGGGAAVGADSDGHADVARDAGSKGTDDEGDTGEDAEFSRFLEDADDEADDDRSHHGENADGAVLAAEEGVGPFEDGACDFLHGGRALVPL